MVIQARKRFVLAFVAALMLAFYAVAASAQSMPSGCKGLTSSDAEWWFRQCYMYETSPSAGSPRITGFVVR